MRYIFLIVVLLAFAVATEVSGPASVSYGTHCPPPGAFDGDSDGFSDGREFCMGTDPLAACPATDIGNDEPPPDAWPPDANDDQDADVGDLIQLFGGTPTIILNPPAYQARSDFDGDDDVDVGDVIIAFGGGRILTSCA